MVRRRARKKSVWPRVLMFVMACLAVGGLIALFSSNSRFNPRSFLPRAGGHKAAAEDSTAGMSQAELEREVARLKAKLAESEQQNADLIVQMKLLDEGSHTAQ